MDTRHEWGQAARGGRRGARGLTLLEACITVAVTAVVAATAAPNLASFIDGRRLESAASRLATDIRFVRGEVVARNEPLRLSFLASAGNSCWVVHTGTAAQCACGDAGTAVCGSGAVAIRSVVLPASGRIAVSANVASILFDPLHGTSAPTATIAVADGRGRSIHHIVNILGRVRSCAAGAAIAGYRAC